MSISPAVLLAELSNSVVTEPLDLSAIVPELMISIGPATVAPPTSKMVLLPIDTVPALASPAVPSSAMKVPKVTASVAFAVLAKP